MGKTFNYLSELRDIIRLDPEIKDDFLSELSTHIDEKYLELRESGLSQEAAYREILRSVGSTKLIAKQMYEVYSQGTWKQAFFTALPHLLIALFFALHLLTNVIVIIALVLGAVITNVYGWRHGKPTWLFPWLGFLFTPVIVVGLLIIYLPSAWTWFAALSYIPLAAVALFLIVKQTLRRDWLFISLMLLPIPVVIGWVFALSFESQILENLQIYEAASWIALSFVILAFSVVLFIRVKQRVIKTVILLVPEILILTILAITNYHSIGLYGWLILLILIIALILGPALLERRSKVFK
jgi:hypothetical protein